MIRAYHLAAIQEYRNWGAEGVYVMAEWVTAGDDRVCEKCHELEGKRFTLDEIESMIPFHPRCRCIAMPVLAEHDKDYKK
jgi:SPP1 gp7 family putative phage head morphogenesis protein